MAYTIPTEIFRAIDGERTKFDVSVTYDLDLYFRGTSLFEAEFVSAELEGGTDALTPDLSPAELDGLRDWLWTQDAQDTAISIAALHYA